MAWNISNILVNEAIANKKAGSGSDLTSRVTALEETVGDESSGLVKDVDDLETSVSGLSTTVSQLDPNHYSSDEIKIGKWGTEDLFRKEFTGNMPSNTDIDVSTGLSNITIRHMWGTSEDDIGFGTLPFATAHPRGFYYKKDTNAINIYTTEATTGTYSIILEYTKNPAPEPENNTRKRGK